MKTLQHALFTFIYGFYVAFLATLAIGLYTYVTPFTRFQNVPSIARWAFGLSNLQWFVIDNYNYVLITCAWILAIALIFPLFLYVGEQITRTSVTVTVYDNGTTQVS